MSPYQKWVGLAACWQQVQESGRSLLLADASHNRARVYRYSRSVNLHLSTITIPPLWRVVIFLGFFVLISGLLGPRIISGGILYRDGFAVYGGFGKAAIFGLIAFVLLVRHKGFELRLEPWHPLLLAWLAASFCLCVVAWMGINNLLAGDRTFQNIALAHAGLVLSVTCAAVACMGPSNMQLLWHTYRHELLLASAIMGVFYVFLLGVYALWRPLASTVLVSVHGLLSTTSIPTELIPPNTLITDKFGITVAQYCSGIESIALFSGLYAIVGLLDRQRLDMRRYALLFLPAIAILFGLNILRVFALIVAGYYVNPKIAFSLFHTYAGMLFFVLYSVIFWAIAYKYIVRSPSPHPRLT